MVSVLAKDSIQQLVIPSPGASTPEDIFSHRNIVEIYHLCVGVICLLLLASTSSVGSVFCWEPPGEDFSGVDLLLRKGHKSSALGALSD